jgi:hypothetical protein
MPGVADGYLTGQAARLTALLPVVEGRLREIATRRNWPAG